MASCISNWEKGYIRCIYSFENEIIYKEIRTCRHDDGNDLNTYEVSIAVRADNCIQQRSKDQNRMESWTLTRDCL